VGEEEEGEDVDEPIDWDKHIFERECDIECGVYGVVPYMSTKLITVCADMCLENAARVLKEARVTGAPVMDGDRLVGVLSRNNLLRALATMPADESEFVQNAEAMRNTPVRNVMCETEDLPTISPSTTVLEAARIMAESRLNRLLVTDSPGKLCGILSSTDAVFAMLGMNGDDDDDDESEEKLDDRLGHLSTMY